MSKITVLTHVALPENGDGVVAHAIRAVELTQALARRGHDVTLRSTVDHGAARATPRPDVIRHIAKSDVVILPATMAAAAAAIKSEAPGCAVVIDMFDAPLVGIIPDMTPGIRGEIDFEIHRLEIERGCDAADFFLCATEEQRLWLVGVLAAWGRISPRTYDEALVALVPTGVPATIPEPPATPLFRGRILPGDATVILWPGGVFNHYRPIPLLQALPQILACCPSAHVVFVGASNSAFSPDNPILQEVNHYAASVNEGATRVWFEPPLPYLERHRMYADADVAVCLFEDGLETELSFRTRLVDMLWGGVPIVTSGANSLSRLIESTGSGQRVASLDPAELCRVIVPLLTDAGRRTQMGRNARQCAIDHFRWDDVVEPLDHFCQRPTLAADVDRVSRRFGLAAASRVGWMIRRGLIRAQRKMAARQPPG